ncbi:MAG: cyanophycin synthetase [Legionellaceae bacterium]|nr:cyanophycin synthetase [Legionellaceae bacterium]
MIEIKELRALRGPNRYTRHTSVFMVLDIKDYEECPSNKLMGFSDRLITLIPSLQEHGCSIGSPGGFIKRLNDGTWAGHIIEHIAIELQCLAGMEVGYGKTFTSLTKGIYIVVFRYLVESVGLHAAVEAIKVFEAVSEGKQVNLEQIILNLKVLRENDALGPTTLSIVKEAASRGIPFLRLNDDSYIQLGHGASQKRIQASMTCQTSAIAVEMADEKNRTKEHLKKSGIPVPHGYIVSTEKEAIKAFYNISSSVVVKPDIGNHGKGSTIDVRTVERLKNAFHLAKKKYPDVIIEEYVKGQDYRLLIINGCMVAAAMREAAHVIGDGIFSIKKLIVEINDDPRRGFGHEKALTRIDIDQEMKDLLSLHNLNLDSCIKNGEKIYLKSMANLSQGATATDVTDMISPSIRLMAERVSKLIGLDCVGVDVIAQDISLPLEQSGLKLVEVNAAPGFRMHLAPTYGEPRDVAKPVIDMLFQESYIPVPIVAVTGTNGKTTTCKLIAHTLKYSGKSVGLACTTGVEINGISVLRGDYSGPEGAGIVLRESSVDHIVLEVARGGIVRRGLGVDQIDVGIVLNVGEDHLGSDWVDTQEELSLVKSTVLETVKKTGVSVLNADDDVTMSLLDRARGTPILFSIDSNNVHFKNHIQKGMTVITVVGRNIIIRKNAIDIIVCLIDDIPITFGGIIDFNISNTLAAIAALYGLRIPTEQIKKGVETFYPSVSQNPGRMNLFDFKLYKVLFDYGHNPESARAMSKLLTKLSLGRKVGLCHGTGNRTNKQLIEYGEALALTYDYIILVDFDPRDRPLGETSELVRKGLIKAGFNDDNIEIFIEMNNVVDYLFSKAQAGDLLVIQPNELEPMMTQIIDRHRRSKQIDSVTLHHKNSDTVKNND